MRPIADKTAMAAHEAATGVRANMEMLGFYPWAHAKDGVPVKFVSYIDGRGVNQRNHKLPGYSVIRTHGKKWRVEYRTGLTFTTKYAMVPVTRKVASPLFEGPIAAAIWLQVEIANGSVSFTKSQSSASPE